MSVLVLVVPLAEGARARAAELVEQGPPFDLEASELVRHSVYLSDQEAVFVFETPGTEPPLSLRVGDPEFFMGAEAWREVIAGRPRKAHQAFLWRRGDS
jgi:hypothetical protein